LNILDVHVRRIIAFLAACLSGVLLGGVVYSARPDIFRTGLSAPASDAAAIASERERLLQDELSKLAQISSSASCDEIAPLLPAQTDAAKTDAAKTDAAKTDPARFDAGNLGQPTAARPIELERSDAVEARLEDAVVMVVAPAKQGMSIGTGFFISPTLIVTNRHVIAELSGPVAYVLRQNSARPISAALRVATSAPGASDQFAPDFAVLELTTPETVRPLSITNTVARLDHVIAAGFPNLAMTTDAAYQDLIAGHAKQTPTIIMTEGRVAAVHTTSSGLQVLPHTAQILPGDSGGPLVDACGRLVGVNTFDLNSGANTVYYAQKSDALLAFLAAKNLPANTDNTPCQANVDGRAP
jgi:S1-C subfamily serine protease